MKIRGDPEEKLSKLHFMSGGPPRGNKRSGAAPHPAFFPSQNGLQVSFHFWRVSDRGANGQIMSGGVPPIFCFLFPTFNRSKTFLFGAPLLNDDDKRDGDEDGDADDDGGDDGGDDGDTDAC